MWSSSPHPTVMELSPPVRTVLTHSSFFIFSFFILFFYFLGHHCTQPLHAKLGAAGSIRASLYFYNNKEDVDFFIIKLKETIEMFRSMPSFE